MRCVYKHPSGIQCACPELKKAKNGYCKTHQYKAKQEEKSEHKKLIEMGRKMDECGVVEGCVCLWCDTKEEKIKKVKKTKKEEKEKAVYAILTNMECAINKLRLYPTLERAKEVLEQEYLESCEECKVEAEEIVWKKVSEDPEQWYTRIDDYSLIEKSVVNE